MTYGQYYTRRRHWHICRYDAGLNLINHKIYDSLKTSNIIYLLLILRFLQDFKITLTLYENGPIAGKPALQ